MANHARQATADRKARLLIDSANYRAGFIHAKAMVTQGLRGESLIQSTLEHVAGFTGARLVASLIPNGVRIQALMPLAVAAISTLLRQKVRYLVLGAGVIAVTAAVFTMRRKRVSAVKGKQSRD